MTALKPQLSFAGAIGLGLGSILGTGVFVSLAIATQLTGSYVLIAVVLAAIVALCNGLSAAQLAAAHPVSGGTYAYASRYLHPWAGFTAGWLFLLAKSASAATAALGFAQYLLAAFNITSITAIPIALLAILVMTAIAASGLQKANWVNGAIVGFTLLALGSFIVSVGLPNSITPTTSSNWNTQNFLEATALLFVAYTGYGRIATMTEEVREPRRVIPIAVIITLGLTMLLYFGVAGAIVNSGIVGTISAGLPPLYTIAQAKAAWLAPMIAIAAVLAMLGVLLNLILGLSRVLMAMGRSGDMPQQFAQLNNHNTTPTIAVWGIGFLIAALVTIGQVKTTWSFSAFNVLIYYALTNLAALKLSGNERLYPRWIAIVGLFACGGLAFWVEPVVWQWGLGAMAIGWVWKARNLLR
jgi:basic amino acid/polyamine antiporter, APA family